MHICQYWLSINSWKAGDYCVFWSISLSGLGATPSQANPFPHLLDILFPRYLRLFAGSHLLLMKRDILQGLKPLTLSSLKICPSIILVFIFMDEELISVNLYDGSSLYDLISKTNLKLRNSLRQTKPSLLFPFQILLRSCFKKSWFSSRQSWWKPCQDNH